MIAAPLFQRLQHGAIASTTRMSQPRIERTRDMPSIGNSEAPSSAAG
jgi:hypothetical protein